MDETGKGSLGRNELRLRIVEGGGDVVLGQVWRLRLKVKDGVRWVRRCRRKAC